MVPRNALLLFVFALPGHHVPVPLERAFPKRNLRGRPTPHRRKGGSKTARRLAFGPRADNPLFDPAYSGLANLSSLRAAKPALAPCNFVFAAARVMTLPRSFADRFLYACSRIPVSVMHRKPNGCSAHMLGMLNYRF
jgi:hypothetical protein